MKRKGIRKKLSAVCLAAVMAVLLTAAVIPEAAWAEETPTAENAENSEEIKGIPEEKPVEEQAAFGEKKDEKTETERLDVAADESVNENETEDEGTDTGTEEPGESAEPSVVYPILIPMESGEQYEQLSAFLSLSADQFKLYVVMFVDAGQTPAQPAGPVQISIPVPAEYDMSRVVVSEITIDGSTPQRTELSSTMENGNAVFQTDHAGLFVVMEKKVQADLPSSLEMTDKVEKLELTRHDTSVAAGTGSVSSVPRTGDEKAGFLWLGLSSAVSTGLILLVIVKSMKISKKS